MKQLITIFIITTSVFFNYSFSKTYYAQRDGNWNGLFTWVDGSGIPFGIPGINDDVIIDGYEVTVTENASCNSILLKIDKRNDNAYLRINADKTLDVTNDVNVKTVYNGWNDIILKVYGTLNIGRNLNFERADNNTTNNLLQLYIQDGSVNVTGDFNYVHKSSEPSTEEKWVYLYNGILNCTNANLTQVSDGKLVIYLRYASEWNISNDFTIDRNDAHDFQFDMYHTSSINVGGDFLLDQNNCQDIYMTFNQTSNFNTTGDFTIDYDQSNNSDSHINIQMWDETNLDIDGSLNITLNDAVSETHNINFKIDEYAQVFVGANDGLYADSSFFYVEQGGELYFELDRDAHYTVYGDAYFYSDGNPDQNVDTKLSVRVGVPYNSHDGTNALLDIKRNCYINANLEDWDDVEFILNSDAIFNVGNNLEINNNINISKTLFQLDRDAKIIVGNDLLLNQDSKGAIEIELNTINNGHTTTTTTKIDVSNNFNITATDLRLMDLTLKNYSEIKVDGDFDINISDYDQTWQGIDALMTANSKINVLGDFTIDNNGGGNNAHTIFNLEDNAFINIGTSGSTNSDFSIIHNGLDELTFKLYNHTELNVNGNFTFDKKNSNTDALLYLNDNSVVNINKHFILKNENDKDSVYVNIDDDHAILNVRGNIDMTNAVNDGRILLEAKWASQIYLGGSLLRNANPNKYGSLNFSGNGTLHMNGDGTYDQIIAETDGDGTDDVVYQYVILNNSDTIIPQFTMEGIAEILANRDLKFTDGIVEAPSTKYFNILDNATVSDASDTSYVDGYVHKVGNDAFTFPVGDIGRRDTVSRYAPLIISAPSSSSTDFYCSYINMDPNTVGNRNSLEETLEHISWEEYWLLKPTFGSPTVNVTLSWYQPRSGDIVDMSKLRVAHWNGSLWQDYGNDATNGDINNGTITVNNISSFSPFTLATNDKINILPVELLSFTGRLNNNVVELNWTTSSEINNDYFIVERSKDGIVFEQIGRLEGAGNSNQLLNYNLNDNYPYSGVSYYRLKQVDYNKEFKYSDLVAINIEEKTNSNINQGFVLYPNPSIYNQEISLVFNNDLDNIISVNIFDINGKQIYLEYEINGNEITLTNNLPTGIYIINVNNNSESYSQKFIVK